MQKTELKETIQDKGFNAGRIKLILIFCVILLFMIATFLFTKA